MKSLCQADMARLLEFLHRAGTAVIASGLKAPTLSVIMHRHAAMRRGFYTALDALADELYGPFESGSYPEPDTFANMFEALCVMLGANEKGEVPFYFRTFAHSEGEYWDLNGTPLAPMMPFPIFGLYMIREGDPYRYGDFLENVFCYPALPDDAPVNQYGQNEIESFFDGKGANLRMESGEGIERMDWTDPKDMDTDPRYSERFTFGADIGDLEFTTEVMEATAPQIRPGFNSVDDTLDAVFESLAKDVTEGAREYFSGNSIQPKAILEA